MLNRQVKWIGIDPTTLFDSFVNYTQLKNDNKDGCGNANPRLQSLRPSKDCELLFTCGGDRSNDLSLGIYDGEACALSSASPPAWSYPAT